MGVFPLEAVITKACFPSYSSSNKGLYQWMTKQQYNYKFRKSELTQERIDALKAIGLDFDLKVENRFDEIWNNRLQELHRYKEEHGCFPHRNHCDNKGLVNWINTQRSQYSLRKPALTQERINALEAIGFTWTREEDKVVETTATGRMKDDSCSGKRKSIGDANEESSSPGKERTNGNEISKKRKKQKRKPKLIRKHMIEYTRVDGELKCEERIVQYILTDD